MSRAVLDRHVLVLNRSWRPVTTTTVRHAMGLAFTGAARFLRVETWELLDIDAWATLPVGDDDPALHSVHLTLAVPEITVLTRFNDVPDPSPAFSRQTLYRRDMHTCQYCARRIDHHELSIDHVLPRSRGGRTTWENCVLACLRCNRRKANRMPEEAGLRLLRPPRRPEWSPLARTPESRRRPSWRHFVSGRQWSSG